jgi:hypothetical protein
MAVDPNLLQHLPIHEPVVFTATGIVTPTWHRYLAGLTLLRALTGTHAQRLTTPASDYNAGTLFFETDRGVLYVVDAAAWKPVKGSEIQDTLANAPTDLTANDAGFLFYVSDFHHRVRWDGAAWQWACGCRPGQYGDFDSDPGAGWILANGTATTKLGGVGTNTLTAVAVTPANLSGDPAYKKSGAAYTGTILAATAPGISGSTGNSPSLDPTSQGDTTVEVQSGTGTTVSATTHVHVLQDDPHTHPVGTLAVDATGEPKRLIVLPYYRR